MQANAISSAFQHRTSSKDTLPVSPSYNSDEQSLCQCVESLKKITETSSHLLNVQNSNALKVDFL